MPSDKPGTAPALPFGSPFVSAMQEPAPKAEAPAPQTLSTPPAFGQGNAPAASGMTKLGFAAVLSGYSVEELGFNPTTLPAWITTSVPASILNEQMSSGNIVVEIGLLIDGISDIGFRNTLSSAKRDFKIKLPQNEVFHALTNMSAAAAAPAAAVPRQVVQPNPPQQPQPQFAAPAVTAAAPAAPPVEPMSGAALNPFTQSKPDAAPQQPSDSPAQFAFSPPAAQAFGSAQPSGGPAQFAFSPPATANAAPSPSPSSPMAVPLFSAAQPKAPSASAPLQPLAGAFQAFGNTPAPSTSQPAAPLSAPLAGAVKPFDPFASSASGPLTLKASTETGFSSAQLLGQAPAPQQQAPGSQQKAVTFSPAPESKPASSLFASTPPPEPAPFQPTSSFAPALEEIPSFAPPAPAAQPASRGLFNSQPESKPLFANPVPPVAKPAPVPQVAPSAPAEPAKMAAVKHSFLGLAPVDTQTDQLLLRALLGTEEKLAAPRVVELLASQHGLSACVCLHGSHVLSHADSSKPDALEFQRQAPDIARQLRGLAPLIGIEGAETFTLNAGGRLLTFCFPGNSILGVLHDDEPSTGMRDKITLIARELSRMLG